MVYVLFLLIFIGITAGGVALLGGFSKALIWVGLPLLAGILIGSVIAPVAGMQAGWLGAGAVWILIFAMRKQIFS